MSFITDQQTLNDLDIFGRRGNDSIYGIFNQTRTRGGAELLEEFFRYPLSSAEAIRQRSGIIDYFQQKGTAYPFAADLFDTAEHYLANYDERSKLAPEENTLGRKLNTLIGADAAYQQIVKGVSAVLNILSSMQAFIAGINLRETPYREEAEQIAGLLADPHLQPLSVTAPRKLSYEQIAAYDRILRYTCRDQVKKLLYFCYTLDVYIAVADVAGQRGFVFPSVLDTEEHVVRLDGVYHPKVKDAVGNDILIAPGRNVVFLTGANMAGKSTFMKSLAIAVYLAHTGFPVAAARMEFSVRSGLLSSINLPDDLNLGYSHFYAEVLRVKKVAELLNRSGKLFMIFDELFRGTNVKDAYEATVAVTEAFSRKPDCMFVVSTHIIEAGEELQRRCDNILYTYLPTRMEGTRPVYTYQLEEGITADRHGMVIVRNEGITDILEGGHAHKDTGQQAAAFQTDKQTLDDLNLTGRYKPGSVFSLFNRTKTEGGARLMESYFRQPLADAAAINHRKACFWYFQEKGLVFPFDAGAYGVALNYLSGSAEIVSIAGSVLRLKVLNMLGLREEYEQAMTGLEQSIRLLQAAREFFGKQEKDGDHPLKERIEAAGKLLSHEALRGLLSETTVSSLSLWRIIRYEYLLKQKFYADIRRLTELVHEIDVYTAVAEVAQQRGFTYAEALAPTENRLLMDAVYHPAVPGAVANSIGIDRARNVVFLTGANMAGKSTFMKSFGIAVYLAHMGFPVAAARMEFSVGGGLYTSINVPDNLNLGYSHFYAEVHRVKKVAEEVSSGKNLFVIFDELFKGTNVKDAYDATLSVSEAFSEYRNCCFIISTHITEAGESLRERCDNFQFVYFPTLMEGTRPVYTYRLREGISTDRHGMTIIENERIPEILSSNV